jgi:hypothetical protein
MRSDDMSPFEGLSAQATPKHETDSCLYHRQERDDEL